VVHGHDPGMAEERERARLALEAPLEVGLRGQLGGEELHRHRSPEAQVPRFPHRPHAAAADLVQELERVAEPGGRDVRIQEASRAQAEPPFRIRPPTARTGGTVATIALVGYRHERARTRSPISRSPSASSSTVAATSSRRISRNRARARCSAALNWGAVIPQAAAASA